MPVSASAASVMAVAGLLAPSVVQAPAAPLVHRANDLVAMLNGQAAPDSLFAPPFLAQVPPAQVAAIAGQLSTAFGRAVRVASVIPNGPNVATLSIAYERGTVEMSMTLDPTAPNLITGLLITGSAPNAQTPAQTVAEFRALPGKAGFAIARLGDGPPQMLVSLNPDQPLAIGSTFKLVILAEMVRATAAGERHWDDTITLDGHELPGGTYAAMPAGARITLLELAQKMISISDNSATDILLKTLGRDKVEAMMPVVGIRDPARNRPFLTALEMFKIKGVRDGRFSTPWPTLDEAGRRALLQQIDATPNSALDASLFAAGKPLLIDHAEWFASPADLVRVMDWLYKHSESGAGAEARAILAINPGITRGPANAQFSYLGYKGGSEPGVIGMTFLLRGTDGWYAISGGWNNPAAPIEDGRFVALVVGTLSGMGR